MGLRWDEEFDPGEPEWNPYREAGAHYEKHKHDPVRVGHLEVTKKLPNGDKLMVLNRTLYLGAWIGYSEVEGERYDFMVCVDGKEWK